MKRLFLAFLASFGMTALAAEPLIVAHRMGAGERDENVLPSLKECYAKGIRAYELDIHVTSDDKLYVSHDNSLKRRCGVEKDIEDLSSEDLGKIKTVAGNPIPTLKEMLSFLEGKSNVVLQVEIKAPKIAERLPRLVELAVEELRAHKFTDERLLVISFSAEAMKLTKEKAPEIKTGFLCGGSDMKNIDVAKEIGCDWISAELASTPRRFADKVHKEGMKLALWTIRADRDFTLAKDLEGDAIVTDYPVKYSK